MPDRPQSRAWIAAVAAFWLCLPLLKLQVSRLIPFDVLVLGTLGVFVVAVFRRRFKPRPGGPLRWVFYASVGALIVAGFTSGLHAIEVDHWLLETAIFAYVLAMLACTDFLARGRLTAFLKVGGIVVATMSVVFGLFAVADLLTGIRFDWLYNPTYDGSPTERFSGPARYCNQWAMFYVCVFPLLLSLLVTSGRRWRPILLAAAVLGLLTVPLTGSRLGTFLVVAELAGFTAVYLLVQDGSGRVRKSLSVGIALVLGACVALLLGDAIGDSAMVQRAFGSFGLVFDEGRVADDWRAYNWSVALDEFASHPVLGIGLGTFRLRHDQHEVHSSYLSLLAETGVAGLAPYAIACLAAIGGLGRALVNQVRAGRVDPWLIGLGVSLVAVLCLGLHFNTTRQRFVWLIFALAVFYADRHSAARVPLRATSRRKRTGGLRATPVPTFRHQHPRRGLQATNTSSMTEPT